MARTRIQEESVVVQMRPKLSTGSPPPSRGSRPAKRSCPSPGPLAKLKAPDPTFAEAIQKYVDKSRKAIGKTKAQVLNTVAANSLAKRRGSTITSADWVQFARDPGMQPQPAAN